MSATPAATSPSKRHAMQAQRERDTAPEMAVRRACHAKGLRYFVDRVLPLPGVRRKADLTFPTEKVAVFVDSCFWHGCPRHGTWPKANADWWRQKLERNRTRDRDTDRRLRQAGWHVVRVWEHDDAEEAADQIEEIITEARRFLAPRG